MFRKNAFAILLFVLGIECYSALPFTESSEQNLQFNLLRTCLTSSGVNSNKIHRRNRGSIYTELNWQWNTLNGYLQPLAYLVATDVPDIQKAVICCRLTKVRIVARSGGHSYVKNGFGDSRSLVVDLAKLNEISVDPKQMTSEIGAGARLGYIAFKLSENGNFLIPGGIRPAVGIAGLTLGGGYGRYTTTLGLTSDNVIEMEMVDARGQLLLINNSTNRDLFWALRGGGGGNFGIVTKFKCVTYAAPRSIVHLKYEYNFEDFSRFYGAWQSLITSGIPSHVCFIFQLKNDLITMELFAFNFEHQNETVNSTSSFLNLFSFPIPVNSLTEVMSYVDFLLFDGQFYTSTLLTRVSQLAAIRGDKYEGWKKVKSIMADTVLNENQISELKDLFGDYIKHSQLYVEPIGGATATFSRSDTAFIHRGKYFYQIQLSVFTPQNQPPDLEADREMTTFYEKSKRVLNHRESYQNYLDQDIDDPLERYYGANLKRLVQIKRRFAPENVFHHPQSIPVNFPKTCD